MLKETDTCHLSFYQGRFNFICWAIALVRQMAARLRLDGRLSPGCELSIQHLIDYTPKYVLADSTLKLEFLDAVESSLITIGTVLASTRPLSFPCCAIIQ